SVVAGVGLVVVATRSGGADVVRDDVRRVSQIQTADLGPDAQARKLGQQHGGDGSRGVAHLRAPLVGSVPGRKPAASDGPQEPAGYSCTGLPASRQAPLTLSIQRHAASTSSSRTNSVWSPLS